MARIKQIELSETERAELKRGYREGKTHSYRRRCQMILLKSEKRSSEDVAAILECCEPIVNRWLKRYEEDGMEGLKTKAGQGRKPILDAVEDLEAVKKAVQANRKKLSLAKAELEETLNKNFSNDTLKRYVKKTVDAINESENVPYTKAIKRSIS